MLRFNDHSFDPDTGELRGPSGAARLQPKPAQLLGMLLLNGGELVEREDIRAALWPDTTVDFDAGLNTCVGQIRAALRDTGGEADYVETLPKRGYRFRVSVRAAPPAAASPAATAAATVGATGWMPYVVALAIVAAGTAWVLWGELNGYPGVAGAAGSALEDKARLAVVPFVDPSSDARAEFNRDLTEAFVAALVDAAPDDIVVIGPSTTAAHYTDGRALAAVAAAVDADFVLHGGHRSSADVVFVEVVLPDGEHLFAQRMEFDLDAGPEAPADVVAAMTASMLETLRR